MIHYLNRSLGCGGPATVRNALGKSPEPTSAAGFPAATSHREHNRLVAAVAGILSATSGSQSQSQGAVAAPGVRKSMNTQWPEARANTHLPPTPSCYRNPKILSYQIGFIEKRIDSIKKWSSSGGRKLSTTISNSDSRWLLLASSK